MRDRTENKIILVLIRHGATQANKEHRYLGKTDESLYDSGRKELRGYKEKKFYQNVEYLFSSPMKRCLETAEIIYPGLTPVIIPEWAEINFGDFEYKNYDELKNDARYKEWIDSGGSMAFPGGESREEFILRSKIGLKKMCKTLVRVLRQNEGNLVRVGCIVHGGTIMALLCGQDGKGYFDYQVPNGGGYISKCCISANDIYFEDIQHLNTQMDIV